jgi:lysophospholipase L1-like esterase
VRAVLQRGLLVAFGLVVALGLIEVGLRVAALVLPARLQRAARGEDPAPGERRILCVGDSHTYGVGVEPAEAYPAQLQDVLRARGVRVHVVNAGAPGRPSGQLRETLPADLAAFEPQIVVVWVGANNQWVPIDDEATVQRRFRDNFRIVRLARFLLTRTEGVSGDFRREMDGALAAANAEPIADQPKRVRDIRPVELTAEITRRDLGPIVRMIREAGATPVFLTYPVTLGPMLTQINRAIVEAGRTHGVRVVDLPAMTRRHLKHAAELLLPDMHPTPLLYRAIGWEVARTLVRERVLKPSP